MGHAGAGIVLPKRTLKAVRNAMRFSIVVISYRRDDALRDTLDRIHSLIAEREDVEIVFVDNNPDETDRGFFVAHFTHGVYRKPGVNRGVAGGRNEGIEHASGDILVFLDDDALIYPDDFLVRIERLYAENPKVGILAVKSINFFNGELELRAFPHTDKSRDPDLPFKTFRYIGVCHAIRREVFDRVGIYIDEFFYGAEEFDLSYRAIKAGYEILYAPEIHVLHKRNPAGRMAPARAVEQTTLNKMRVGFMHLPLRYFLANILAWSVYALWLSRGRANIVNVWGRFGKWARANRALRQPVTGEGLAYLRRCKAQLWK